MNTPNKITITRFILTIILIAIMVFPYNSYNINIPYLGNTGFNVIDLVGCIIFIVASITDFIDGHLARKNNLVTDFGKFMDPLADKLLVCSALIALVDFDKVAAWIVIIIIAREFIISGFRLIASDNGIVIAASYWGKFKTNFQMFMIIMLIIDLGTSTAVMIENILIVIATALTIISLVDYLVKNKQVLSEGN